jgi:hypothetical protein
MKQDEFVEAAFDAGEWLEEHWKTVLLAIAGAVGVVLIVLAFMSWRGARRAEAAEIFAEGLALYRDSSTTEALERFEQASAKAGGAPLGDVATLYQGLSQWETGNASDACRLLDDVARGASNPVLSATAKANLASALAEAGEPERAESVWRELAAAETAYFPKDLALLGLGKLLIAEGRVGEAQGVLREVVDDYPQTASMTEAQALLDGI